MRGWRLSLLACLGLLAAVPAPVRADAADPPVATRQGLAPSALQQGELFTPDDLLLFEVEAEGRLVSDALPAYSAPSGVYLPLGELARMLELAIVVDPSRARADGWVLREERTFRLDLAAGTAEAGGRELRLAPEDAALAQGEIYVRAALLEELLPLRLKADARSLMLEVSGSASAADTSARTKPSSPRPTPCSARRPWTWWSPVSRTAKAFGPATMSAPPATSPLRASRPMCRATTSGPPRAASC